MKKTELESDPNVFDLSKHDAFSPEAREIWRPAGAIPLRASKPHAEPMPEDDRCLHLLLMHRCSSIEIFLAYR